MRKSAYIATALLAFVAAPKREPINVGTGDMAYSDGSPFVSRSFYGCSAVVVDCGDEAVFVHAIPPINDSVIIYASRHSALSEPKSKDINVHTAHLKILEELKNRGVDMSNCKAMINGGSDTELIYLSRNLRKHNIRIRRADTGNDNFPRDVFYDSLTDEMRVVYNMK